MNIANTGSKEFPYFQVIENGQEFCATDSLKNAEIIVTTFSELKEFISYLEEKLSFFDMLGTNTLFVNQCRERIEKLSKLLG